MVIIPWPDTRTKILNRLSSVDDNIAARIQNLNQHWLAAHDSTLEMDVAQEYDVDPEMDESAAQDFAGVESPEPEAPPVEAVPEYLR